MAEASALEDIDRQLERETKRYADKRAVLEDALAEVFRDPSDTVDSLLSWADEFGREHALELFAEEIHKSPDTREISPDRWSDVVGSVNAGVQDVLDSQDRLDDLTSQRQKLLPGEAGRLINVQGEIFEIDPRSMRARSLTGHQSIEIDAEQQLTLTEQLAQELDVSKAEPNPTDRDRGRSR